MSKITVSDFIVKYLEEYGITHAFGLVGGGAMYLFDSLRKSKKIKTIVNLHEQCSAICADGYSQYKNDLGVCFVTTGPGGTNAITGVAASYIDSIPILVISGQVKTEYLKVKQNHNLRQHGPQEIDIVSIVKPITKYAITIEDPLTVKYYLQKAMHIAMSGRKGTCWLDVPLDVQNILIDDKELVEFHNTVESDLGCNLRDNKKLHDNMEYLISMLNKSKSPIILAGNGIRLAGCLEKFKSFVEYLQIPVLTTWKASDFFDEDYKYYFGRPGSIASRYANIIQQNSDCIICIGTRLDLLQVGFNYRNFGKDCSKIFYIDIDDKESKKLTGFVGARIVCDLNKFFDFFEGQKDQYTNKNKIFDLDKKGFVYKDSDWIKYCKKIKEKYPIMIEEHKENNFVNPYYFIETLSEITSNDYIIIPASSGSASEIPQQAWKIKEGQRMICNQGLGSMGFTISHAIGSQLASGKNIICICGDGDVQHNLQEIELIKRYNLPIKIFIWNNNGYNSIRKTQDNFFESNYFICDRNSGMTTPEISKIANLYDLDYELIADHENLNEHLQKILNNNKASIIEVLIDPNVLTQPRIKSKVDENGKIVSSKMEDMWPFLSEEEMKENIFNG